MSDDFDKTSLTRAGPVGIVSLWSSSVEYNRVLRIDGSDNIN
jgi:hypothetical protein